MMRKKGDGMSIQSAILQELLEGETINSAKAKEGYNCPSLNNVINRLKMKGVPVEASNDGFIIPKDKLTAAKREFGSECDCS